MVIFYKETIKIPEADSKFLPSQWETDLVYESKASFAERWLHSLHPESEAEELCLTLASSPVMEMGQLLTLFLRACCRLKCSFYFTVQGIPEGEHSKSCPFQKVI